MEYLSPFETPKKRPTMLTVLPILTFIGSGLNFIVYLFLSFATDFIPDIIEVMKNMGQPDAVIQIYEQMLDIPSRYFLLLAGCYALAIVGAALMMSLRKAGFHLYIVVQILLFCVSNFMIGGAFSMGVMGIFWSVLFIVLYGLNYKYMNQPGQQEGSFDDERWKIDKDHTQDE